MNFIRYILNSGIDSMLPRHLALRTHGRFLALSVCVSLLNACAWSPGMKFSPEAPLNLQDPNSVPTIIPITLESVRKNNASLESNPSQSDAAIASELISAPRPYLIGPGDVLSIIVWDHPELVLPTQTYNIGGTSIQLPTSGAGSTPQGYVVRSDGSLQFPYAGSVQIGGLSEEAAQRLLTQSLARVINNPQVTVRITGFRSQRVYVDGEVKAPGVIPLSDVSSSIVEALNQAGGVLPTGDPSQIILSRAGRNYTINLPSLLKQGISPSRILLQNADMIKVVAREENKIFVVGEVSKPTAVTLRNGSLTLNEALGDAGGVNPITSDPQNIYVIRYQANIASPVVYHLDGKSPVSLALAENFQLQRKDVVYVDSAPVVRWNRFISNLIPGLNTTVNGARLANQ